MGNLLKGDSSGNYPLHSLLKGSSPKQKNIARPQRGHMFIAAKPDEVQRPQRGRIL